MGSMDAASSLVTEKNGASNAPRSSLMKCPPCEGNYHDSEQLFREFFKGYQRVSTFLWLLFTKESALIRASG